MQLQLNIEFIFKFFCTTFVNLVLLKIFTEDIYIVYYHEHFCVQDQIGNYVSYISYKFYNRASF